MTVAWPLLAEPQTPAVPVVVVTRSETGRSIDTAGITGRGIVRPFRRDLKRDFANGTGVELVASEIAQALGTVAQNELSSGELPWRTEFGCILHLLRLQNLTPVLAAKAQAFVARALRQWVPRVRITSIRVERSVEQTALIIRLRWTLIAEGTERVLVSGLETEIALG
jgi:phage baseplate assembly protein W